MRRFSFPARLLANDTDDADDFGITVTFRDLPEAITFAQDQDSARARAADCLWTAIAGRVQAREPIPEPKAPQPGELMVEVDDMLAAKAALHLAMLSSGQDDAGLARRLNTSVEEVRRILDPAHATRIDRLNRALAAFRKRLVIDVLDAA